MKLKAIFLLLTTYYLLLTSPVFAHKVNIFAYAEGDTVYTESYFPDGRKVEGGAVEVYDSSGNKLLEGKTDKEGQFNFKPPKKDDLKIILIASMGHRNSYALSADELPEIQKAEDREQRAEGRGQRQKEEPKEPKVDLEQIKQVIETSLDEKLKPIMRELKKTQQKEVSFTEVLGGIGYIFGIFGIILYFATKRRKD